jgi:hypothetical protein
MPDPRKRKHLGVFYAHPSGDSPLKIEKERKALELFLRERFHEKLGAALAPAIYVISGRQEHKMGFFGDWEKWQRKVVKRKHATTGDICYHMFVVPGESCGRATAAILKLAFEEGRQVMLWDKDDNKLKRAKRVQAFDADDWTSGFRVTTE